MFYDIELPEYTEEEMKEDFKKFLCFVWAFLGLPEPTPVQYEIADYLQHGPRRQIIEGFRGVGKSWITSAFVIWSLWVDPQLKFLVVSASKSRSDDFSTFTLRLINEIPMLQHLIPKPDQRESKISFDVGPAKAAHAPSVKSVGVFGQMTGSRAHHIIADDVEVASNSATQDAREKLVKTVLEFEAIIVPEIGRVTFLGTPQTEESVYNVMREKGYNIKIWPARYPKNIAVYQGGLAESILVALEKNPRLVGSTTDPKRFSDMDLAEREAAYGKSGFALQFMLDTSLSDAEKYPLKTGDLIVSNISTEMASITYQFGSGPEQVCQNLKNVGFTGDRWYRPMFIDKQNWRPFEGSVLAIDPSGRGNDELAYCVLKQLHGKLFLLEMRGLKGGYSDENLELLAKRAKAHKVNRILYESNFGDGMFGKILTPIMARVHPCTIEEVRHSIQKEKRIIDTLEPVMNSHRLIVDETVIEEDLKQVEQDQNYSLFYQMTRLTKERGALKHDDRIDVLAMAVHYFVESMARDERKAEQSYHDREFEKELKVFMKHVVDPFKFGLDKQNDGMISTRFSG